MSTANSEIATIRKKVHHPRRQLADIPVRQLEQKLSERFRSEITTNQSHFRSLRALPGRFTEDGTVVSDE